MTAIIKIKLTRGLFATVDANDAAMLARYRWHAKPCRTTVYAQTNVRLSKPIGRRKYRTLTMHRFLLGEPTGQIDHVNTNGLDNRRNNLRHVTQSQNLGNQKKCRKKTHSKYKGVTWHKKTRAWVASLRSRHLGYFADEKSAAEAYDFAAAAFYGVHARLNFPKEKQG